MKPGDVVGGRYEIVAGPVAVQGKEGCRDVRCTRNTRTGQCVGWHCPDCGAPTSSQGHINCPARAVYES